MRISHFALLCIVTCSVAHEAIVLHYTPRPPYTVEGRDDLTLGGVAGERVTTILRQAHIAYTLHLSPPLRQLDIIRANKGRDCSFDWYKTPERESFARFSEPFAQDSPYVFVARKELNVAPPVTLNYMVSSGLTMARIEGYSYGKEIDDYIYGGKLKSVYSHGSEVELLTMIRRKRADFGLLLADEMRVLLQHNELMRAELRVYPTSDMPAPAFTYFLCAQKVDVETMNAFNATMKQLPFVQYQ